MKFLHVKSDVPATDAQVARILNRHPDRFIDTESGRVLVFHVEPNGLKRAVSDLKLFSRKVEIVEEGDTLFG